MQLRVIAVSAATLALAIGLAACGKKAASTPTTPATAPAPSATAPASPAPGHGGGVIELGSARIGPFDVKATRDLGQLVAGKDAPIDVIVNPASGQTAKVGSVRFWIGGQDAKGSVKAKADIENPKEPNHWHTHAEIPSPIPAGAKLWVEIDDDKGATSVGSFELQA